MSSFAGGGVSVHRRHLRGGYRCNGGSPGGRGQRSDRPSPAPRRAGGRIDAAPPQAPAWFGMAQPFISPARNGAGGTWSYRRIPPALKGPGMDRLAKTCGEQRRSISRGGYFNRLLCSAGSADRTPYLEAPQPLPPLGAGFIWPAPLPPAGACCLSVLPAPVLPLQPLLALQPLSPARLPPASSPATLSPARILFRSLLSIIASMFRFSSCRRPRPAVKKSIKNYGNMEKNDM